MINISEIDEMDNRILNIIENNARLSYSEIGEKVGLSRVSVKTRMDNLVSRGVINKLQASFVYMEKVI